MLCYPLCVCVCVFSKRTLLAPPNHYPFNVLPTADSSIYGTGLYLPIKPFIVQPSSMVAVTWFSHFLWGTFTISQRGEDKAAHHRCLPKYGRLINPSWPAAFWKYFSRGREREREREEGVSDVAYCIACNCPHSTALS